MARILEEKAGSGNGKGAGNPALTAWRILFKHLQARPNDILKSGQLDRYLDAMEKAGRDSYFNQRAIYAFYKLHGLNNRAKSFRERDGKAASRDLDCWFEQADQNPSHYSE